MVQDDNPPMIDPDEALALVVEATKPLTPRRVALAESAGLRLAEDIEAADDFPSFDRAMMDGYAVCVLDVGRSIRVMGEVSAGNPTDQSIQAGGCMAIMTGAPCPPGTEAVVQHEKVVRQADRITFESAVKPGKNIVYRGSERRKGALVLRAGDRLTSLAVAALASNAVAKPLVIPKPRIAIITTGEELRSPDQELKPGHIRDSNGPMLTSAIDLMGMGPVRCLWAGDDLASLVAALEQTSKEDVVVVTGGVSAGKYDLVPQAIRDYGGRVIFHRVSQKPGKPLLFAQKERQLLFCLPGNPLAVHLCFYRYVADSLRRMSGHVATMPPLEGCLERPVRGLQARAYFVLARATCCDSASDPWRLTPLPGVSSADVFGPSQANCYLRIPAGSGELPQETRVRFYPLEAKSWLS